MNRDFWVGIFVLFGLAILLGVYTTLFVGGVTKESVIYHLQAKNVMGISSGIPVMMQGYELGTVESIEVITEPNLHFDVQLAIKPNISIPRGSSVVLGTRLAGGGFIDVRPPDSSQGLLSPDEKLELQPAVDVQNVLESVNQLVVDLQNISSHARKFVEDPEQGVEKRLKDVDVILAQIQSILTDTNNTILRVNTIIKEIEPKVNSAISAAETTAISSSELVKELGIIAVDVDQEVQDMGLLIEMMEGYAPENNTEISTALKNVEILTKDMHEMVKSLKAVTDKLTQRKGRNSKEPEQDSVQEDSVQEELSQKELHEE